MNSHPRGAANASVCPPPPTAMDAPGFACAADP
eukprot:CAMPEP_0182594204 /NCGR_PEP_ID=MMETSP1324-20130603/79695_1 /TAXON_ID=236786 /ORGANISM="Florenciella sp., Strain RCC1587" /LENGTH=32 /DNA_ID= /DNA_START= /DNA_END= /DNA_ORIENTATION=